MHDKEEAGILFHQYQCRCESGNIDRKQLGGFSVRQVELTLSAVVISEISRGRQCAASELYSTCNDHLFSISGLC